MFGRPAGREPACLPDRIGYTDTGAVVVVHKHAIDDACSCPAAMLEPCRPGLNVTRWHPTSSSEGIEDPPARGRDRWRSRWISVNCRACAALGDDCGFAGRLLTEAAPPPARAALALVRSGQVRWLSTRRAHRPPDHTTNVNEARPGRACWIIDRIRIAALGVVGLELACQCHARDVPTTPARARGCMASGSWSCLLAGRGRWSRSGHPRARAQGGGCGSRPTESLTRSPGQVLPDRRAALGRTPALGVREHSLTYESDEWQGEIIMFSTTSVIDNEGVQHIRRSSSYLSG